MPSKYIAKNPRAPKIDMTDTALLAKRAREAANDIRAARRRCTMATIKATLRICSRDEVIRLLTYYYADDELEMVATDLKARKKKGMLCLGPAE